MVKKVKFFEEISFFNLNLNFYFIFKNYIRGIGGYLLSGKKYKLDIKRQIPPPFRYPPPKKKHIYFSHKIIYFPH